ncbi:MAG: hypothetical protein NTX49_09400 [Chlamydiae bacterium]|nr:hypothetical protein [Chlamydiota bacterium]
MAVQAKGGNSLGAFNADCLRNILDLCSLKDKARLKSCSKLFQSAIQQFPKEAKAFLVFESKLPLIKDIIRMTPLYRARELSLQRRVAGDQTDAYLQESAKGDWIYIAEALISYYAALKIMDISSCFENLDGLEREFAANPARTLSGPENLFMAGGAVARFFSRPEFSMLIAAGLLVSYVAPRLLYHRDRSVPLMNLWYDLRGAVPDDLLSSSDCLEAGLAAHNRLALACAAAGGMDRYYAGKGYTAGGLNHSLSEIRHKNLVIQLERLR